MRKSVLLLVAATGLVVSLSSSASTALEVCVHAKPWLILDETMDEQSDLWAKKTPAGCLVVFGG